MASNLPVVQVIETPPQGGGPIALAASTLGFPSTVAVWTWVRDVLK